MFTKQNLMPPSTPPVVAFHIAVPLPSKSLTLFWLENMDLVVLIEALLTSACSKEPQSALAGPIPSG